MGTKDKLVLRFRSNPKDFTFGELKRLLQGFGYLEEQGVVFIHAALNHKIKLHKPHPGNILKRYQMDLIEQELQNKNIL
jgi:hypothetical protein